MNAASLLQLLQIASPALPIGGFSYSQGFESAVAVGLVKNEKDACSWIKDILTGPIAACEGPIWVLIYEAWQKSEVDQVKYWNEWFLACRETNEFRLETQQMGWSLVKLSEQLAWVDVADLASLQSIHPVTYPCAHAYMCQYRGIDKRHALTAYFFSWLENQAMAAIKSIPLGQTSGQRILQEISIFIPAVVEEALDRATHDPPRLNTIAHQLAILSSIHETQYSRLFRS
ncbi:urease accessory protein UreF [Orrella sp. NBD-18]|uniref:Urease accessory protein UreF n=1 Tax=Sheuella amnicola TaxID=2707330 RepID=A0A6B2R2V7_9BURK|nr:urease accessory protein UreF [Sheuella amnicola]NDY84443.1 urease accessory protein UreF [Sheuella amnicola]